MLEQTPPIKSLLESKSHRLASLWEITRKDGTVLRYTDHQTSLTFDGNTFSALSAGSKSALRSPLGLKERNLNFLGYLSTSAITDDHLRSGLYNEAQVTEYVVDWRYPWQGTISAHQYYITEIVWTGEDWEAQLNGMTTLLRQPKGRTVGRRCGWILGDSNCAVNIVALTVSDAVDTAIPIQRRVFETGLTQADGYFDGGLIVFTTGDNSPYTGGFEVDSYLNLGGQVSLILPTPFDIASADDFDIYPGCSKVSESCKGTAGTLGRPWANNFDNFGGFPHVPGDNTLLTTPNSR